VLLPSDLGPYTVHTTVIPPPHIIPAISNICFVAGTLIKTDQGLVAIEEINTTVNTIEDKPILAITKTLTLDTFLIRIEPHTLYKNYPNKTTILTKDHLISFKRKMVTAYSFLDYSDNVRKVKYNGELLYNVLLTEHTLIEANNMRCESLDPTNVIAKIYMSNLSATNKNDIVFLMNKALVTRDLETYRTLVQGANLLDNLLEKGLTKTTQP
jgi:hypothetical protein